MRAFYVYIMAGKFRTLYTGVTNNLERRVLEHKRKLVPGFTSQYNISRLVYFETFGDIRAAIQREKRIKGWLRAKEEGGFNRLKQSHLEGPESGLVWARVMQGFSTVVLSGARLGVPPKSPGAVFLSGAQRSEESLYLPLTAEKNHPDPWRSLP